MQETERVCSGIAGMTEKDRIEYIDGLPISPEDKKKIKAMMSGSVRDPLTGLYTRGYFLERVSDEVERFMRSWYSGSRGYRTDNVLGLADMDHFKRINDVYGHQSGDRVLADMGSLMQEHFRDADIAGRYGGEEFGVILVDCRPDDAKIRFEGFRHRVYEELRYAFDNNRTGDRENVSVTISAGLAPMNHVTELRLLHGEGGLSLIKRRHEPKAYASEVMDYAGRTGLDTASIVNAVSSIDDFDPDVERLKRDGDYRRTLSRCILIKNADNSLYEAKHQGRNRIVLYRGFGLPLV